MGRGELQLAILIEMIEQRVDRTADLIQSRVANGRAQHARAGVAAPQSLNRSLEFAHGV